MGAAGSIPVHEVTALQIQAKIRERVNKKRQKEKKEALIRKDVANNTQWPTAQQKQPRPMR
eukprot:3014386-Rhodomonas_salina.1